MTLAELAAAELRLRLRALLRGLEAAVERRRRRSAALVAPGLSHLAITDQHAQVALAAVHEFAHESRAYGPGTMPAPDEHSRLEAQAAAAGARLPGRVLADRGLGALDVDLLLLVAAPAVDPAFGTLYGYVHDALNAVAATPHLAVEVLATSAEHERRVREAAGPFGTLRSEGWVAAAGTERGALTALHAADGVLELLCGSAVDAGLLGDRAPPAVAAPLPGGVDREVIAALADALRSGRLEVVGVWGAAGAGSRAVAAALTGDRPVVRASTAVEAALQRAAIAGAVCLVDVPPDPDAAAMVAASVAAASAPVVLVGEEPLRATELIAGRRYAELQLPAGSFAERRVTWSAAFPHLDPGYVADLAARFRLQPDDVAAVAALDRAASGWARNGDRPQLGTLAGLVARRRSPRVASIRAPQRGPEMLVLPPAELAQVMDVAAASRAWPRVADAWRLERFGNPGVTALFAGEPGTGKTLAAEVIASLVGIDLMVVDLSRLVSKWVGETEKHLDAVFAEAEASSCVLFFDEADSVFGRRGEVARGADRYANLEVGYLLQRLERYDGLVVLASNLRANLDAAFTRRFHHVVHFPRPAEAQRRQLWDLALAPPVRLAEPLDIGLLAALELTGAGIAAIVRSAALAVHGAGREALTASDLLQATVGQFRREARLLPHELLGDYADLVR